MASLLSLVLPIVIPSWRFFKTVEPSPRIEWTTCGSDQGWSALYPDAQHVPVTAMAIGLFWNADRNDALYMVSCAERLVTDLADHWLHEIQRRIQIRSGLPDKILQFRVVFLHREDGTIKRDILYLSEPFGSAA